MAKHMLGIMASSPIKRPNMTIAVDWDAKPQLKQTNKQTNKHRTT